MTKRPPPTSQERSAVLRVIPIMKALRALADAAIVSLEGWAGNGGTQPRNQTKTEQERTTAWQTVTAPLHPR